MFLIAFFKMFSVMVGGGKVREGDGEKWGKEIGKGEGVR